MGVGAMDRLHWYAVITWTAVNAAAGVGVGVLIAFSPMSDLYLMFAVLGLMLVTPSWALLFRHCLRWACDRC